MMIQQNKGVFEGEIINKYMKYRFEKNKNYLAAITGPTGSGKTYTALRMCELWYKYYFDEKFPIKNVCFSVSELMRRLSSGELREGDILILEEAGVNAGSSDWQNKIVKMFNYVLQSFRSMNVGIIMTLPVLTMLAKQARQLLHTHVIMQSIDFDKKTGKAKIFFHQLNQSSGKSYWKYFRIKYNGKVVAVQRSQYGLISEWLRDAYEIKKTKFVSELTQDFSAELDKIERDKLKKDARANLSRREMQVLELSQLGLNQTQTAKKLCVSQQRIGNILRNIRNKGYNLYFGGKSLEKPDLQVESPPQKPSNVILPTPTMKTTGNQ